MPLHVRRPTSSSSLPPRRPSSTVVPATTISALAYGSAADPGRSACRRRLAEPVDEQLLQLGRRIARRAACECRRSGSRASFRARAGSWGHGEPVGERRRRRREAQGARELERAGRRCSRRGGGSRQPAEGCARRCRRSRARTRAVRSTRCASCLGGPSGTAGSVAVAVVELVVALVPCATISAVRLACV